MPYHPLSAAHSGAASHDDPLPSIDNKHSGNERRSSERRGKVVPLESREKRLRFAAQAAGFGTYDLDCVSGDSVWSAELLTIAGLPEDKRTLSLEQVEMLIHPDDRKAFREKFHDSLRPDGTGEFEEEHRIARHDGAIRWVKTKGRTVFVEQGGERRPLASTGVVMDVTASHLAQIELVESREELSKLVDSAIEAIVTIDENQQILRFNPAAARTFGCSVEEAVGSPLDRFIPQRDRDAHTRHVRRFAKEGTTGRPMGRAGVFSGLRANGAEFPIEASIAQVLVGGRRQMTVFLRDITERVEAEEALRRSKEDLELALRGGNIGTWHWDLKTGVVDWSDRTYQLFGVPKGETMTMGRFFAAVHPLDREAVKKAVRRSLRQGEGYNLDYRIVLPDESIRWIQAMGSVEKDPIANKAVGIRGVALEVTERKIKEQVLEGKNINLEQSIGDRTRELIKSNEALERSNLELQQFAFVAAHDLQTPLRSISGFAQLLQKEYRGRLDAQADEWLGQMVKATRRMHQLIQDLLSYSRVESRGNPFQPFAFKEMLDDVLATLGTPIRETGAVITADELPDVEGDRNQLAQVMQNLIDNAIKYNDHGPPRIHISAERKADEWEFSVRDDGIGIREKHQEQIFEIFRRLHTQQEYPGTGIGLAVCRRVIHRHGGRIWVESREGKGSTFHFTLPQHDIG